MGSLKSLQKVSFNLNSMDGDIPVGLCNLQQLQDCRIGSDMKFAPYDTSPGSPEKSWLLNWKGNNFNCPVPKCIMNGVCSSKDASPVPSPVKCHK